MSEEESVKQEEITVQVRNRAGLHARPAAEFVKRAGQFDADIQLAKQGLEVNGKSIMGVLMLAAEQGTEITIRARGDDAVEAVDALATFVNGGFDEE